jgi:hypothetical protein
LFYIYILFLFVVFQCCLGHHACISAAPPGTAMRRGRKTT